MATKQKETFIVRYKNDVYDIAAFRKKHPGGINTLSGMQNSDIGYRFENAPPHSEAAKYLLKEYLIKEYHTKTTTDGNDNEIDGATTNNSGCNDEDGTQEAQAFIQTDDSMEVCVFSESQH